MEFKKDIQDDVDNFNFPKVIKKVRGLLPLPLLQMEKKRVNKLTLKQQSVKNKKIEKENDNNEEESIFQYFE